MSKPEFYPSAKSVAPGDVVDIHASAGRSPCVLRVRRIGLEAKLIAEFPNIQTQAHPIPQNADQEGCGWPACLSFEIGANWETGYYDLELTDASGASSRHYVVVRPAHGAAKRKALLILATNTYDAYNYWGGRNAYENVYAVKSGEMTLDEGLAAASGKLSSARPFPQTQLAPDDKVPRLVNDLRRGFGEPGFPTGIQWLIDNDAYTYDGSAGFVNNWEQFFVEWAERNNVPLDYATDYDFVRDPKLLDGYPCAILVGHNEYWSAEQRDGLDRFVEAGGGLAVFSGNTGYWKVRWEDPQTMIAHKWRGETHDPLWADPATRPDATHMWSHPAFGRNEAEVIGLSFLYGGYHRIGMAASRGASGYTIYNDKHWALEGADVYYGDVLGGDYLLIGYENDGCPITFGADGLPIADGGRGIPDNLEIIGFAPATVAEPLDNPFPALIPREDVAVLAEFAFGSRDPQAIARVQRGHAVMASFKKGEGEVFNGGATEWVHGLKAGDKSVETITMNVLKRFGAL